MIWVLPLQGQEPVRGGHQRGVVIPPEPGASFVVVQAEFAFELLVVEFDLPSHPGEAGESFGRPWAFPRASHPTIPRSVLPARDLALG